MKKYRHGQQIGKFNKSAEKRAQKYTNRPNTPMKGWRGGKK